MYKFIASLLLVVSLPSFAGFYDGNDLSEWSKSRKKADNNTALQEDYVNAAAFRGFVTATFNAFQGDTICAQGRITAGQVQDVVSLYIESHPELSARSASELTYVALTTAFPCQN